MRKVSKLFGTAEIWRWWRRGFRVNAECPPSWASTRTLISSCLCICEIYEMKTKMNCWAFMFPAQCVSLAYNAKLSRYARLDFNCTKRKEKQSIRFCLHPWPTFSAASNEICWFIYGRARAWNINLTLLWPCGLITRDLLGNSSVGTLWVY